MPHFRLAAATSGLFVRRRICIVRMNLNREFIGRKDEFDEKRELRNGGKLAAAPLPGHFCPSFPQGSSSEWPRYNFAIHTGKPRFSQWLAEIRFFRKERRQRPRPPNPWAEDGLDACGRRLHEMSWTRMQHELREKASQSDRGFSASEKTLKAPQ